MRQGINSKAGRRQLVFSDALHRRPARREGFDAAVKRTFDIVVASVVLVIASPLMLGITLAILVDSPGGVLYRCSRIGRKGQGLSMLKFRKMHRDASGAALTVANDQRFTRPGRFLARTKLDELPQVWNVLKGEMSFVARYRDEYSEILLVRPGITGLCQLAFAKESEILDPEDPVQDYLSRLLPQKVALDRLYAHHRSIPMDLRIFGWTFIAVILRQNVAVNRSTGRLSLRRRPNGFVEADAAGLA
jgi:lipopolysaccharide/colanic/teichoic acid biosynthesis glycosyltransferase